MERRRQDPGRQASRASGPIRALGSALGPLGKSAGDVSASSGIRRPAGDRVPLDEGTWGLLVVACGAAVHEALGGHLWPARIERGTPRWSLRSSTRTRSWSTSPRPRRPGPYRIGCRPQRRPGPDALPGVPPLRASRPCHPVALRARSGALTGSGSPFVHRTRLSGDDRYRRWVDGWRLRAPSRSRQGLSFSSSLPDDILGARKVRVTRRTRRSIVPASTRGSCVLAGKRNETFTTEAAQGIGSAGGCRSWVWPPADLATSPLGVPRASSVEGREQIGRHAEDRLLRGPHRFRRPLGINILDGEKLAVSQYNADNPLNRSRSCRLTVGATRLRPTTAPYFDQRPRRRPHRPCLLGRVRRRRPHLRTGQDSQHQRLGHQPQAGRKRLEVLPPDAVGTDDAAQGTGRRGDYLTKTLGAKTVAVIDDSSVYGKGLADVVRSTSRPTALTVTYCDPSTPPD